MRLRLFLLMSLLFGAVFVITPALAQPDLGLDYGAATGLSQGDLRVTIARVVQEVMGLIGIVLVCLVLYAGFLWMTAAGNDEQIEKARKIISGAVIGLIIILSALTITTFVIRSLTRATR